MIPPAPAPSPRPCPAAADPGLPPAKGGGCHHERPEWALGGLLTYSEPCLPYLRSHWASDTSATALQHLPYQKFPDSIGLSGSRPPSYAILLKLVRITFILCH